MSSIHRSIQTVTGNMTVNDGDVIITNPNDGLVMEDNVGDTNRLKIVDDGGVKTIEVEQI